MINCKSGSLVKFDLKLDPNPPLVPKDANNQLVPGWETPPTDRENENEYAKLAFSQLIDDEESTADIWFASATTRNPTYETPRKKFINYMSSRNFTMPVAKVTSQQMQVQLTRQELIEQLGVDSERCAAQLLTLHEDNSNASICSSFLFNPKKDIQRLEAKLGILQSRQFLVQEYNLPFDFDVDSYLKDKGNVKSAFLARITKHPDKKHEAEITCLAHEKCALGFLPIFGRNPANGIKINALGEFDGTILDEVYLNQFRYFFHDEAVLMGKLLNKHAQTLLDNFEVIVVNSDPMSNDNDVLRAPSKVLDDTITSPTNRWVSGMYQEVLDRYALDDTAKGCFYQQIKQRLTMFKQALYGQPLSPNEDIHSKIRTNPQFAIVLVPKKYCKKILS